MSRGGARPGAGRRAGSPNRATAAKVAEIEASGITPLDYMLTIMRDLMRDPAERLDAAKSAAPYVHPRLAAIDHRGEVNNTVRVLSEKPISQDEWAEQYAGVGAPGGTAGRPN